MRLEEKSIEYKKHASPLIRYIYICMYVYHHHDFGGNYHTAANPNPITWQVMGMNVIIGAYVILPWSDENNQFSVLNFACWRYITLSLHEWSSK